MKYLEKTLRNQLERIIKEARIIAEEASYDSLKQLGIERSEAFMHLDEQERILRKNLRAHARQLGDIKNKDNTHNIDRLVEEMAYQHWHRMLFARFLAENNLLMYSENCAPVPISLDECQRMADEENISSGWELAARFATKMLPQIFRPDSPVFKLSLAPEKQVKLEELLDQLPPEVFLASDSLGWVYQFWQSKRKDEINTQGIKIGERELPAVTQLFTEPYMVEFLLDNALGAWWAKKRLTDDDWHNAQGEEELRQKAGISGMPLKYLRFIKDSDNGWRPASGFFEKWPDNPAKLTIMDPCCGSGHFLVSAFLMMVKIRIELEGLCPKDAVDLVIRENIHGLEIDRRCVELAVFALALVAWEYPGAGGYRDLPPMNIACCGLSVKESKNQWAEFGKSHKNLAIALGAMHEKFTNAPILGSLIDPSRIFPESFMGWDEIRENLNEVLEKEKEEVFEAGVVAQGIVKSARLLATKYQFIITNVPYLARGKQDKILADYCNNHFPLGKSDLATVFLERCLQFCENGGNTSIVLPQNWLFLVSYKKFREKLLKNENWNLIARLGSGAFETISGEIVKAILISISKGNNGVKSGLFADGSASLFSGIDVSEAKNAVDKAKGLGNAQIKSIDQAKQLENPDARVVLGEGLDFPLLTDLAQGLQGIVSSDYLHFGRLFWELGIIKKEIWIFHQSTVKKTVHFGGKGYILMWENGEGELAKSSSARVQGLEAWDKKGIAISQMREIPSTLHSKSAFDNNTAVIIPKNPDHLPAIWCFCLSPEYNIAVRKIDQALKVTNATLIKVPFDLEYWTKVAQEKYPNGLPQPYSDDPTQWIYHGHPCGSVIWNEQCKNTDFGELREDDMVLQVAVARLLGFRWPAELDIKMELAPQQRKWVQRCDELLKFADKDGIVCIPPVGAERAAKDRILDILAASYGDSWSYDILDRLLKNAGSGGKNLEKWLRDDFFLQHCKIFRNRPFIWHIWDGKDDGFSALINYHRLDYRTMESLIYNYLGGWINRLNHEKASGADDIEDRLVAAENLKKKLELILMGEAPYDIFVRWKPLEQQSIGWNPDLNDGVRLNIRPFMKVPDVKIKDAGIFRIKPNITWKKDRGKDVKSAPWYNLGPKYGGHAGDRINDHHLRLEEKRGGK